MASEFLVSFLGAVQASLSVLLTIAFGVVAAQFGLVTTKAAEEVSRLCVKVLLPCLLIVKLGSELDLDTAVRYVPIVVWALITTVTSIFIGKAAKAFFGLPAWAVPAIAFNNTESLPLLLLESLEKTGVLATLVGSGDASEGIERARSYFLACSVINNTITFSQGANWITGEQQSSDEESQQSQEDGQGGDAFGETGGDSDNDDSSSDLGERTSLLPNKVIGWERRIGNGVGSKLQDYFYSSPKPLQKALATIGAFINPPFIGAAIGLIIGLSPPLHRLFFNDMDEGGYFNAWLTSSIKNVGDLFVSLQVIVVGVKLSLSLRLMKEGGEAGTLPLGTVLCVSFVRFILWPAISIPLIWALAAHTNLLPDDPMLWWALMMMPIGPTAMKVLALADVSGASQSIRMSIARFLTLSYIITPIVSFAVVGALEAAKAAKQ
ncbi:membrane transport protein-domain-containing protein [Hypoxylon rubiginosum]|uniref:Membrane transport protein-domain-containing protein n=1 Tax=Hypoxylon rubiginosum TaxID=110542 RepID=A0ACC0DLW0_9PEZI|nr:membrane transport protein-domain-containing protein [Hypoxylon rubiginosum]